MRALVAIACVAALATACRRDKKPPARQGVDNGTESDDESTSAEREDAAAAAPARGCSADEIAWRLPWERRVVAIGDVHGDEDALESALRAAGVIDESGRWSAGETALVQTGDILDRGDDELEIYQLFGRLADQADEAGGRVVLMHGNHELMNAAGDYRYVTAGGWKDWADQEVPERLEPALAEIHKDKRGRIAAWAPGGPWALRVADQPVIAVVGDSVFAHGGVLPEHVGEVTEIHQSVQCWLRGKGKPPSSVLASDTSPVWTRLYAAPKPPCEVVDRVLKALGVSRMVIGHTPQLQGIQSRCGGKLWLIDVGMAEHYGGEPAALIIDGDEVRSSPE